MASYHLTIKSGKKGQATEHAAYIARARKYSKNGKGEDLLALEHGNLPEWANGDPIQFWKMADKFERANGSTYREFELALPRELSLEQNLALVRDFVRQEVGSKPYHLAIHAPEAALGEGPQPHSHIMVSDRLPDQIERPPEKHFGRFNASNPERGGCRKDSGGKEPAVLREELKSRRARWADLQNRHLELNGHATRVDHRSNRERGIDDAQERHLGSDAIKRMNDGDREKIREERMRE